MKELEVQFVNSEAGKVMAHVRGAFAVSCTVVPQDAKWIPMPMGNSYMMDLLANQINERMPAKKRNLPELREIMDNYAKMYLLEYFGIVASPLCIHKDGKLEGFAPDVALTLHHIDEGIPTPVYNGKELTVNEASK